MLQLGTLFTLKVAGQRLTFVTDASDVTVYFNSQFIDFQQAVQKPVNKAGNYDSLRLIYLMSNSTSNAAV